MRRVVYSWQTFHTFHRRSNSQTDFTLEVPLSPRRHRKRKTKAFVSVFSLLMLHGWPHRKPFEKSIFKKQWRWDEMRRFKKCNMEGMENRSHLCMITDQTYRILISNVVCWLHTNARPSLLRFFVDLCNVVFSVLDWLCCQVWWKA